MFERYTERARRVIFLARYEASQFGSPTIETEHLLLGLTREDSSTLLGLLPNPNAIETIRTTIEACITPGQKLSTSIDLPLSNECKQILEFGKDEAMRLDSKLIGTEHLLLGILCAEACLASRILTGMGLDLEKVREDLSRKATKGVERRSESFDVILRLHAPMPEAGVVPDAETAKRIAEAVWLPRVSAAPGDQLEAEIANLTSGVWIVTGTHSRNPAATKLAAFIQKEDGKILRVHVEKVTSSP